MRIGVAADRIGVATHVLRHWEDVGVLVPGRDAADRRTYDNEIVARGRLVVLCQRAGLSLEAIRALLDATDRDRAALLTEQRRAIATQMANLHRADAFLAHTLECRHPVITECPECREFAAPTDRSRPAGAVPTRRTTSCSSGAPTTA